MSRVRTKNRIQGRGFSSDGPVGTAVIGQARRCMLRHYTDGTLQQQVRTAAAEDWLQTEAFVIGGVGLVSIALALRYGSKAPAARAR